MSAPIVTPGTPKRHPAHLLREARRVLGLSQEQLAERAGVSARTIRNIEARRTNAPRPSSLRALADALYLDGERRATFMTLGQGAPGGEVGRTAATPLRHSVPAPLTNLVGRTTEVCELHDILLGGSARLVTITGIAGMGKTRLAAQVGRCLETERQRVCWLAIAPDDDARAVMSAMAEALGAPDASVESMTEAAAERPTVLVLDDLTDVDFNGALVALLERSPTTAVVATSRAPLGIAGEHQWPLGPLAVPSPGATPTDARSAEAVELLVDRVRATLPAFEPVPEEISVAAEVTRRLGGIPLAIELAAREWRVRGGDGLLASVRDNPLDLHAPGLTGLRHSSLRQAVEATCAPLDPACRRVLRALASLAGAWSIDAACAAIGADGLIERLDRLLALGLVEVSDGAGEQQFTINPAVRAFAAGDADRHASAHADRFEEERRRERRSDPAKHEDD